MKPLLLVIDNLLTAEEIVQTKNYFTDLVDGKYRWIDKGTSVPFPLDKILQSVSNVFDLSDMAGCECWAHVNTNSPRHIDVDDELWDRTGEISYPICSIVYYPLIKDLKDGNFIAKTFQVTPQNNRLIAFSKGLSHSVSDFTGERIACAINPWSYKKQK